ncbi:GNAT family N-acetyltransferase [Methylobacterium trifolii]|nr:GNAT family N-acetyltransferase [Methylobacterium trifolii]
MAGHPAAGAGAGPPPGDAAAGSPQDGAADRETGAALRGRSPGGGAGLRPEAEADGAFLFALFAAVQGGAFAGVDPGLAALLLRQGFAGQAAGYRARYPRGRFAIVEHAGAPAGRLVTDRGAEAITIVDLALMPESQGRGLGTALVRAVLDEARAAGLPVRLSVLAGNPAARRLYERLGFTTVATSDLHHDLAWTPTP